MTIWTKTNPERLERFLVIITAEVGAALTELHTAHQVEERRAIWECQVEPPWKGAVRRNTIAIHFNIANSPSP